MKKNLSIGLLASLIFTSCTFPAKAMVNGVTITVSDWNGHWTPPNYGNENNISPLQWHYRLPFFSNIIDQNTAQVRDDNQPTIDKEIQFAAAAGIDSLSFFWWNFEGFGPRSEHPGSDMNHNVRFYLSSEYKNLIKFSVTAPLTQVFTGGKPLSTWDDSFIPNMITFMKNGQYQKTTISGVQRPIIYFYSAKNVIPPIAQNLFPNELALKDAIQRFRSNAQQAGLPNPYIVDLSGDPDFTFRLGMDAVSSYTASWGSQGYDYNNPHPFSELMQNNKDTWSQRAAGPVPHIPNLNIGWDYRPGLPSGPNPYGASPIFVQPTPQEIADYISSSITYVNNHQAKIPAKTLYIYAWAENEEGGYLAPTIYEGDARLEAIAKITKGSYFTSPRFKGVDLNSDQKVDIFDFNQLVRDFGRSLDSIPLNADITADGKVDINDYIALKEYLGK